MEVATLFRPRTAEWPLTSQPRRRPGAAGREHPGRRLVVVAYGSRRQARAPRWGGFSDLDVEYRVAFQFAKRSQNCLLNRAISRMTLRVGEPLTASFE